MSEKPTYGQKKEVNDYVGKTVYHCHFMFHGDYGMMGTVEMVK